MRFLVDECTGPQVARWLESLGHDVLSAYDQLRGLDDDVILARAVREQRILITNDTDFGEQVYREQAEHTGVVLLRLRDESPRVKIDVIQRVLQDHVAELPLAFVVASEAFVRIRPT